MAVLDGTGAFIQTNHVLQRLLGLVPDDILGHPLETIVAPKTGRPSSRPLRRS
jgi:PAS domain-containing protein